VPIPYLQGEVCTSCSASPHYRWTTTLSLDVIAQRLSATLAPFGRLTDVQLQDRDGSGRARSLELVADHGSTSITGSVFRRAVGTRALPSLLLTNLQREPDGASVQLDGGGLGHGVGLCQWGARGMALAGSQASDILAFYFPGTTITSS
jgi:stage II sporulation protein D